MIAVPGKTQETGVNKKNPIPVQGREKETPRGTTLVPAKWQARLIRHGHCLTMPASGVTVDETGCAYSRGIFASISACGSGRIFNWLASPGFHLSRDRCQRMFSLLVSINAFNRGAMLGFIP